MRFLLIALFLFAISCGGKSRVGGISPPSPIPYKTPERKVVKGSLWQGDTNKNGFLFQDAKALGIGDVVTVILSENVAAEREASTESSKEASNDYSISNVLGWGKGRKFSHFFAPEVTTSMESSFEGKGKIKRKDKLTGVISAIVVDILPNGNLVIEGRKKVRVNQEDQYIIIRGIVRPEDISSDNTVYSTMIANAEIYYYGKGSIGGRQKVGWGTRLLDILWPF